MAQPLTIGLTGGIAAGKSEALAALERLGAATISSDAIVHELLDGEPLQGRVIDRWGPDVAPGGAVDRGRIGEIVFDRPGELAWLEEQVHPLVGERIASWLGRLPGDTRFAVVEVPLLFEAEMEGAFDVTLAISSSEEVRRSRAEARGHRLVPEREARQLHQDEKASRADHVVVNDGSLPELEEQLSRLLERLAQRHDQSRPGLHT